MLGSKMPGLPKITNAAPDFEAFGDSLRRNREVYAEFLHHIGRAALRGHAAVPVLCHPNTRAGYDQGRRCRYIERPAGISARSASIDERVAFGAADVDCMVLVARQRSCRGANRLRKANDLIDGLAFHAKRHKKRADLGVAGLASKNGFHHLTSFLAREVRTMDDDLVQDVDDHKPMVLGARYKVLARCMTDDSWVVVRRGPEMGPSRPRLDL